MPVPSDQVEQFFSKLKMNCNTTYIKSAVTVPAVPMKWGTRSEDQVGCSSRLLRHLEAVYLPSKFEIDFIKNRMGTAYEFGRITYGNQRSLMEMLYDPGAARRRWPKCTDNEFPVLLTGRAGVGKSALLRALARVMNEGHERFFANPEHSEFHVKPVAFATGENGHSGKELLKELAELSDDQLGRSNASFKRLIKTSLIKRLTCMFYYDEAQFAISDTAKAIRNILIALQSLRFPWALAANYDLVKKLLSQEEQYYQRFARQALTLSPPQRGSVAWKNLLAEYDKVFGEKLETKLVEFEVDLWDLSCGIPRVLINILQHALDISLERKSHQITADDLGEASHAPGVKIQVQSVVKQLGNDFPSIDTDSPLNTEAEEQYRADVRAAQDRPAARSYALLQAQERADSADGSQKEGVSAAKKAVKPKPRAIPSKEERDSLSNDDYNTQFASPAM